MDKVCTWRTVLCRLPFLLLLPLGMYLPRIFSNKTSWMERYAEEIYPLFKDAISSVSTLLPISLAEFFIYLLCILIPLLLIREIIRLVQKRSTLCCFVNLIVTFGVLAGVLWNLFYVTWGFNYFREPLASRMELPVQAREAEDLAELTVSLAEEASMIRAALNEDENGVFAVSCGTPNQMFSELTDAYAELSEKEPVLAGKVTPAKSVEWSEGLSWLGISGIYIGLTAEPNVNVHQPDLLQLHAAAHEMAHQLGIASEDAAEFVGFLACMSSDNPEIQYSGLMNALVHCGNALSRADKELYAAACQSYSDDLWRDFTAYNAYWERYEGKAEEIATETNDSYLKHNAQPSGVRSYGESVDLLLAYFYDTNREQKIF